MRNTGATPDVVEELLTCEEGLSEAQADRISVVATAI